MSFSETIFLFFLALIIFGPKKLPEMARQAGRLLAELRRASNEFKSQIETEIAHLEVRNEGQKNEVQKNEVQKQADDQTILPPSSSPQGTVPSLSLNPAQSTQPAEVPATLASPAEKSLTPTSKASAASDSTPATEAVAGASDVTSQASHV